MWTGARDADPKKNGEQTCEANDYLGEWEILKGRQNDAVDLLRKAREGARSLSSNTR